MKVIPNVTAMQCRHTGYDSGMKAYQNKELTITYSWFHSDGTPLYHVAETAYAWEESCFVLEKEESEMRVAERLNKDELMTEGFDVLESCDIYSPTQYGMEKIWDTYVNAKSTPIWNGKSVFDILAQDPDYIPEKGYIVKSSKFHRSVDWNVLGEVLDNYMGASYRLLEKATVSGYEYPEAERYYDRLNSLITYFSNAENMGYKLTDNFGRDKKQLVAERNRWSDLILSFDANGRMYNGNYYTNESYKIYNRVAKLFGKFSSWAKEMRSRDGEIKELLLDDEMCEYIEELELDIKGIRPGQKLNKVIGKIARQVGLAEIWEDYNRQSARLGDAVSPVEFTRYTIISANWIDYWTMSFGKDWCSCANIDKEHKRYSSRVGMYGDGCCSSGTESYMLDPSTVVMYTVDANYDGTDFELQDKINRCLFHIGEGKFIMGRVYPQGTDGEEEVYREWRGKFQKVMADCMNLPNYWKTKRDGKYDQYVSYGIHYEDYNQSYCNVAGWSYIMPTQDAEPSGKAIVIGHNPICPDCGCEHDDKENIQCCGSGRNYCTWNEEYTNEDGYDVDGYGWVCNSALDNNPEHFFYCDYCEEWHYCRYEYDYIDTEDGHHYCDSDCAENDGYRYVEDCNEWYYEDEVHWCEHCNNYVLDENWNEELECCEWCEEKVMEENAND